MVSTKRGVTTLKASTDGELYGKVYQGNYLANRTLEALANCTQDTNDEIIREPGH